ncbi:MAG: DUF6538 domain-containing protein [Candidatus Electronema sp. VV]
MTQSDPHYDFLRSFLSLQKQIRHLYYFRCRIPEPIKLQYNCGKVEVRKSLQTKDFEMALKNARRLWV